MKPKASSRVKEAIEATYENQYEKENVKQEGTLKPYKQFSAEADAETLRKAMKGVGRVSYTDKNYTNQALTRMQ